MGQSFSSASENEDRGDLESSFTAYFNNIEIENKIIPPEIIRSIKRSLRKGDVQQAHYRIRGQLEYVYYAPINVAVTGDSGVGKSSFINALRGVGPEEDDATQVGTAETAMRRTPYKHPKIETLTFWELPGIGTMNIPPKYYLEKVKFQEYDFFVILSATRFKLLELDLAQAIRLKRKNCYFVRTKVDADLQNEKESKPCTFDRVKTLQLVRRYCVNTFIQNNMDAPPIFLISNHNLSDYNFPVLMDTLIKYLPAQKHHNFILSLPNNTEAVIEKKHKSMQQFILLEACQAGILATVPTVDILMDEVEELKVKLNHYQVLFGLDDESLEVMANDSQVPVEQLKKNIKSPYLLETKKEETLGEMILKYVEKFASANGGPLATGHYFGKTFYLQLYFLDTVTEDAKVLLRKTYFKKLVQAQLIHSD
ncbi:interferon-inducible GTPase 1-like [Microtus ochrogaster]|uniref:Interferon-inducible GTPase 1-like n=1 Tax=Microtus ochrogaster TaxID=79684 RepID=A0ABM0KZZ5_MICOH|nr:interferon-inducible GTPase 1-like [Microtus ochrogaster]